MGPQSPHHHRQQARLTLPSRARWSRPSRSPGRGSGPTGVQPACPRSLHQPARARQVHDSAALAGAKRVPRAHTHMQLARVKHAHVYLHHHSRRTLTHCAPTQGTAHVPRECTHIQMHLYAPLNMYAGGCSLMSTPCHTHLQPQGPTITDSRLPKLK